jgi:hypothetical protein
VPLSRISWLLTTVICLVAAVLLLVNDYVGYFGVLLAVGAAAAINLVQWPHEASPPPESDAARRH